MHEKVKKMLIGGDIGENDYMRDVKICVENLKNGISEILPIYKKLILK